MLSTRPPEKSMISSGKNLLVRLSESGAQLLSFIIAHSCSSAETRPNARLFAHLGRRLLRQACSPLIQFFLGFASDINQTNINRDMRDGDWLSSRHYHKGGEGGRVCQIEMDIIRQQVWC